MFGILLQTFFRKGPESSQRTGSGSAEGSKSGQSTEQEQKLSKDEISLVIRKSKQIKINPIVKKAIQYVGENSPLDWFDMLRFNVLSGTNETISSLDEISMDDLFRLNDYVQMKTFVENVAQAVQDDEIERMNNKPRR